MLSENLGAQEDKLLTLERIYGADEVRKAESDLSKEEKPRSVDLRQNFKISVSNLLSVRITFFLIFSCPRQSFAVYPWVF